MTADAALRRTEQPRRSRWTPGARREFLWALLFLLPWIIGFLVFTGGPMLASFVLSLTNLGLRPDFDFVGTANYERLTTDPRVRQALTNTVIYTVLHVPSAVATALLLALMLLRVGRAAGFFRTVFYLPAITPAVATAVLFLQLRNGNGGLVNRALEVVGIAGPNGTTDPEGVKPGIVLMTLWTVGSTVVILFAALRNVPIEQYEAARIDGANSWQQFRSITLPFISGPLFFVIVINTISSLQMFDQAYTMFGGAQEPAPGAERAALFYNVYLFDVAFESFRLGYASALAWALFIVILLITIFQLRLSKRWVYYEGE